MFSPFIPVPAPPLPTFSDGSTSKTVTIPAGGGKVEAAKIRLPLGSTIVPLPCSAELKIDKAGGTGAGTPFIWVPLSGNNNQLVQIKTSDGTIVHTFSNGADNCASTAFSDPSRITVLPGAAVWVANRSGGSVTRLGLKTSCTGDNCYECKGTYSDIGDGPRGATYDKNGNIWVGAYDNDKICKYKSDGTLITCKNSGCRTYGMIGDMSGNVWVSDRANARLCQCSGDISCGALAGTAGIGMYGIGMDNEGDIWFAGYDQGKVYEADHSTLSLKTCGNVGPVGGPRGVAVDGNNKVWVANSGDNKVYVIDQNCNAVANIYTGYSNVIGVAIDDQNNGWIVSKGSGRVLKYQLSGNTLTKLLDISVGDGPYNYSDMTGFRTPKISITIGDFSIVATNYPQVINDANYPGFSNSLNSDLEACSCQGCAPLTENVCGNPFCDVPITISSTFLSGSYTLSDLKVNYDEPPSKITGGLVPCGRNCDDTSTLIREDAPCTLCATFVLSKRVIDFTFAYIVIPLAVLMLVIGGVLFLFAAEDTQRINQARALLTAAVIGLVVVFATWLVVNLAIFFLTGEMGKVFGKRWNEISCPFCGDGICNSSRGENNTTCRYDCP